MLKFQLEDLDLSPSSFLLLCVFLGQSLDHRVSVFSPIKWDYENEIMSKRAFILYYLMYLKRASVLNGSYYSSCVREEPYFRNINLIVTYRVCLFGGTECGKQCGFPSRRL